MAERIFNQIVISSDSASSPIALKAMEAWPDVETHISDDPADFERKFEMEDDPVAAGKRSLLLAPNKGRFIRKCPGTMGLVCCNYWVIDLAEGCAIDCSYCILQGYLTDRRIRLATNIDDLKNEIDEELNIASGPVRFGTGELSDSLMFDHKLNLAEILIDIFRKRPGATLELKTKTANIQNILELKPADNIVIAWSLNTPEIVSTDEKGSASLENRLAAAGEIVEAGWKVAFHFDPLIIHEGWREGYSQVVDGLFNAAPADKIAWISLGALRFHPSLKPVIKRRFPQSEILNSEFTLCPDNKMRYAKPIRRELLTRLRSLIIAKGPHVPLYFCMEGIEMWKSVFGGSPGGAGQLKELFG